MSLFEYESQRIYGMVLAVVSNNQDPQGMGRVKVRFHMLETTVESDWCRVVSFFAGARHGAQFLPEVDDEVVVAFEHGDINFPIVMGSLYNGKDKPPVPVNKDNNIKLLQTKSGHILTFNDTPGQELISLKDGKDKRRIIIDVKNDCIQIEADTGDLTLKAPSGTFSLDCKTLDIKVSQHASLDAKGTLKLTSTQSASLETKADARISATQKLELASQAQAVEINASTAFSAQGAQVQIKSTGPGKLEAGADLVLRGSIVHIN